MLFQQVAEAESSSRPAAAQAVSALRTASPIRPRRACPPSQGRSGCRTTARSVCEASPTTQGTPTSASIGTERSDALFQLFPRDQSIHALKELLPAIFRFLPRSPSPQTSAGSLPRLPRLQARPRSRPPGLPSLPGRCRSSHRRGRRTWSRRSGLRARSPSPSAARC